MAVYTNLEMKKFPPVDGINGSPPPPAHASMSISCWHVVGRGKYKIFKMAACGGGGEGVGYSCHMSEGKQCFSTGPHPSSALLLLFCLQKASFERPFGLESFDKWQWTGCQGRGRGGRWGVGGPLCKIRGGKPDGYLRNGWGTGGGGEA